MVLPIALDVSDAAAIESITDQVASARGSIDILVNCVGVDGMQFLLDISESGVRSHHLDQPQGAAVRDPSGRAAREAEELLGGLDILVNNAGFPGDLAMLHETTDAIWERTFSVNVDAVFRLIRACVPMLRKSTRGRIITTASVCPEHGLRSRAPMWRPSTLLRV